MISAGDAKRSKAVLRELEQFVPDVAYVHGYALPYLRKTMDWANKTGVPVAYDNR